MHVRFGPIFEAVSGFGANGCGVEVGVRFPTCSKHSSILGQKGVGVDVRFTQ